jgi:hypothetical protein
MHHSANFVHYTFKADVTLQSVYPRSRSLQNTRNIARLYINRIAYCFQNLFTKSALMQQKYEYITICLLYRFKLSVNAWVERTMNICDIREIFEKLKITLKSTNSMFLASELFMHVTWVLPCMKLSIKKIVCSAYRAVIQSILMSCFM